MTRARLRELIAGDAVRDLLDDDGRPLGEAASPARYAAAGIEETRCPYPGARHGQPMNLAALRQLGSIWEDVLDDLGALRGPDATLYGAWRACLRATVRPVLVALAADREPVSRLHSATYKASLGFAQVFTFLLLSEDGMGARPLRSFGIGAKLVAELDRGGWLLGDVQACAGPNTMIADVFEVLAREDLRPAPVDAPLDLAEDVARELMSDVLAELGGRRDRPPTEGSDASRILDQGRPSWVRAITMEPHRQAADAARLSAPTPVDSQSST